MGDLYSKGECQECEAYRTSLIGGVCKSCRHGMPRRVPDGE